MIEALHEANLPKGLLNVVTGLGNVVGAELYAIPTSQIRSQARLRRRDDHARRGETMKRSRSSWGASRPPSCRCAALDQGRSVGFVMAFFEQRSACAAGTRYCAEEPARCGKAGIEPRWRLPSATRPSQDAIGPMVRRKQYERVQFISQGLEEGAEVPSWGGSSRRLEAVTS